MNDFLDSIVFRLRARRGLARAGWYASAGCGLVGVGLAVSAWVWVPWMPPVAWSVLSATLIGCALQFLLIRFSRAEAAQVADLVLGTQSLFVTAIDPSQAATRDAHDACVGRAESAARGTDPKRVVPLRFGARWLVAALPAVAAVAIVFAPVAQPVSDGVDAENTAAASAQLDKAADRLEQRKTPEDIARAERLRRLSRQLKAGDLTRREALEEVGELKRQLRADKLERATDAARAQRGAEAASRSLGQGEATRQLSRELGQAARAQTQAQRDDAASKAQESVRELATLDKEEREAAAEALEKAAQQARAQGNEELAQALEAAAGAVRSGDAAAAQAAGAQLAQAMRGLGTPTPGSNEGFEQALAEAQAALNGQPLPPVDGGDSREGEIAPGPRNWAEGNPGPGDGEGRAGAGRGHSNEEDEGGGPESEHQDADRFGDKASEAWNEEYEELYEAALLNSDGRIATRVQGERSGDGKVQVVRGGQQAPREERARGAIANLPVRYADEAREAVDGETVPPGYRDAVRDYFDAEK